MDTNLEPLGSSPGLPPKAAHATTLLREDHRAVSEMFGRYNRTKSDTEKRELIERICKDLTVHAQIEEEIFYPAVQEALQDEAVIAEAEVEHASLKDLVEQLQTADPGDIVFEAKVKVLSEYVKHHVNEEQTEIFPRARASGLDMQALGDQLLKRKAELMAENAEETGDWRAPGDAPEGVSAEHSPSDDLGKAASPI